jgi:hypothetical protein
VRDDRQRDAQRDAAGELTHHRPDVRVPMRGGSDQDDDDGQREPVVQPGLDVEQAAQP